MACVVNDIPKDQGATLGDLRNTADLIKAVTEEMAHQMGVPSHVIRSSPIVGMTMNTLEVFLADNKGEAVNNIGISAVGAALLAGMFRRSPFVAGAIGGAGAVPLYDAAGNLIDCAEDGLKDLADTMNSNPELNLPAWWNDLRDRFNDATDTPDPILTLRRLGAWGRDPLILDLNGDGVQLVQLEDSTTKFDLTEDGFATLTGWVDAKEALLVLDQNYLEIPSYKAA